MKTQLLTIAIFAVIPLIISCEKKGTLYRSLSGPPN